MALLFTGVLCFAIIAISLPGSSWACQRCPSRKPDLDNEVHNQDGEHDHKTWLFSVNGRKRPYSFLDDYGNLTGFDVDLIDEVCQIAKKRCKMVLSEFTECSFTSRDINYAGRGLMAEWFDGCPGYVNSIDREGAFDFTDPYLDTYASFTVAPGNPSLFDPHTSDYSEFTFTHLTGAVTNSKCLARLGKKVSGIIIAANLPEAKTLLLNRTADVLFSPRSKITGLEVLPEREHCDAGGTAVMLKKGSHLAQWWNPAFESLVRSGQYQKLCEDSQVKYNRTIRCMASPTHSSPESPEV
ncbi:arginine-binding extracellular protein ArtP-like [Elysia marginata]|uniref:Arginine-binding extracellular protein ArtP-like n=1 Tax=Elysia marginata TaxID=1093978 RepID=A0AAV4HJ30_9GAST|nr:arginine-binding extracellular protein ArtP-like [Elysia marginata]